ncbi:hypothetical protein RUM43_010223 [Polyplax serrata]|uniref:Proline-rich protein PRCC n=1 Tax=Polyplax serrata TaxID=468196 RepID=A0AAN8PKA0_POLSC
MPLVDYAASSDEEEDGNDEESGVQAPVKLVEQKQGKLGCQGAKVQNTPGDNDDSVFSALPRPSVNPLLLMDDNALSKLLLNKKPTLGKDKKSETVKISVPSVRDFKDEEDQVKSKKIKMDVKGSGLFSILPPPKNAAVKQTALVPQSVSNSVHKKSTQDAINKYLKKSAKVEMKLPIEAELNEDDEEIPVGGSFFGTFLSESSSTSQVGNADVASNNEPIPPYSGVDISTEGYQYVYPSNEGTSNYQVPEDNSNMYQPIEGEQAQEGSSLELDEKALQILCGGKKKRQQTPMNIIDLSGEEIMPDSKEWLLKQFTEEKRGRGTSHRKSNGPSSQQRRKHQITYLAFQAKEQELELQNQWANNRMSRRQTQSKYGF